MKDRTEHELSERLKRVGFSTESIGEVCKWLKGLDYLNDRRFAQQWIETRQHTKPSGRRRLRMELLQKGVERELVDALLESIDHETEEALARQAAQQCLQRLTNLPEEEIKRKLYSFLSRRGFAPRATVRYKRPF